MTRSEYCEYHERVAARLRSVAATATTSAMKARLLEQAEEHDRIARGESEPAELEHASEAKRYLTETHFAWIGAFGDTNPFYYRILSPVILVEFDHQSGIMYDNDTPSRDHIHTVVRTPNGNDYGKDLLRQHYAHHDHSHPTTDHRHATAGAAI